MSTSSVNYKESNFEHPFLTKIRGEPTYETLHHLKNELKANASSVPITLGVGKHGKQKMILLPAEYHLIMPTNTFTWPPNPGILVPNSDIPATHIATAEDTHRLTRKLYLNTLLLTQTIIQKIIEAVDTKYLAALCNPANGKITPLVPTILNFLYVNYRRITPQQLDDKKTTVKSMTYNPAQPIDLIFNSIDDLVKYVKAAKA